jgi:diketogulonate reductase-like aldo/keto reductase
MSTTPDSYRLNDGHELPVIGFGTYALRDAEAVDAVGSALEVGYRLVDTAVNYQNEEAVGEAVRNSGLPREDVRIATKVPGRFHARDLAVRSVEDSLRTMGLDYLDLVLIHWPNPSRDLYAEAWQALVEVRERGLVRSIGVSNFSSGHLHRIIDETGVVPAVNQLEVHPYFPQEQMLEVNAGLGILTQAWSPLGKRNPAYAARAVADAAAAHRATPAQVVLGWHLQRGVLPVPKSATPARQRENLAASGVELSAEEVAAITALGRPDGRLFGGDPDTHEEM